MNALTSIQTFLELIYDGEMESALAFVATDTRFIVSNLVPSSTNSLHGTFVGIQGAKEFFDGFVKLFELEDFYVAESFGDKKHAALYGTIRHKEGRTDKELVRNWAIICKVKDDDDGISLFNLYHFYEDADPLAIH